MAAAVLEYVNGWFEKTILVPLRMGEEPAQSLKLMCQNLTQFYAQGRKTCLLNAISLGEGDDLFHSHIQQALTTWIEELAQVLIKAGIESEVAYSRAEEAVILIQGALVLVRGLDDTTPFERVVACLPERLLPGMISNPAE